ncbi:1691_t:CDS:2, partial [Racocetra persica]
MWRTQLEGFTDGKRGSMNFSIYGQGPEFQIKSGTSGGGESIIQHKALAIFEGDKRKMYDVLRRKFKKEIKKIIGKRIIYSNVQDYRFEFNNLRNIVSLEMPGDVEKIFSNPDIDSQVFATILNTDENNDIFTYILYTPEPYDVLKIIINCVQSNHEQQRACQVKIGWIIVGYNLDINSALSSSDIRFQSTKKIHVLLNNPSERQIFKMSEDNLLVACRAPV